MFVRDLLLRELIVTVGCVQLVEKSKSSDYANVQKSIEKVTAFALSRSTGLFYGCLNACVVPAVRICTARSRRTWCSRALRAKVRRVFLAVS